MFEGETLPCVKETFEFFFFFFKASYFNCLFCMPNIFKARLVHRLLRARADTWLSYDSALPINLLARPPLLVTLQYLCVDWAHIYSQSFHTTFFCPPSWCPSLNVYTKLLKCDCVFISTCWPQWHLRYNFYWKQTARRSVSPRQPLANFTKWRYSAF